MPLDHEVATAVELGIPRELAKLEHNVNTLQEAVQELSSRLNPILVIPENQPDSSKEKVASQIRSSPLAGNLGEVSRQVEEIRQIALEILKCMEL